MAMKFSATLILNMEAQNDLKWWCALDRNVQPQSPLLPRVSSVTIESDASNMGWGARQGHHQTGGKWSPEEATHHIKLLARF